jgi:hypothetical protein
MPQVDAQRLSAIRVAACCAGHRADNQCALANAGVTMRNNCGRRGSRGCEQFRNDRWVFGDRGSGAYLVKFSWTAIQRHVPVKGAASPDDPALAAYWAERRKKIKPRWTGTPCTC